MRILLALTALCSAGGALGAPALRSGPMVGSATQFETTIWLQTEGPAEAQVRYWPEGEPGEVAFSAPVTTAKADAFVAKCIVGPVEPGRRYAYEVLLDGEVARPQFREGYTGGTGAIALTFATPPLWRFREEGHRVFDFTLGFGSCYYNNDDASGQDRLNGPPYGSEFEIFESIYEKHPDAFVWLGDNVYLREDDWSTRSGLHYRWSRDRARAELRPMLATIPQYFIWDDHDYGPNDIGFSFWNKGQSTEAFRLFTANPSYGLPELPGIFTFFNWGDVNVYLLDNRTYRTAGAAKSEPYVERQMLGRPQIDWLIDLMKWSEGQRNPRDSYPLSFHLVCVGNQVLSPFSKDNLANYGAEWDYLFERLVHEGLNGVIFVTGDVHFGEVSRREIIGGGDPAGGAPGLDGQRYTYFDVTSSSLTAGSWAGAPAEANPYRYDIFPGEADRAGQHNFVLLRFTGASLGERQVAIEFYDKDGRLLNQAPGAPAGTVTAESIIRAHDFRLPPGAR